MFSRNKNLFKELEFLGYDPICIREVLRTHKNFDSALAALQSNSQQRLQSDLVKFGINQSAARVLSSRFDSFDRAVCYFYEYEAESENLKDRLSDMGYPSSYISLCISNLWNLEESIINSSKHIKPPEERKADNNPQNAIRLPQVESIGNRMSVSFRNDQVFNIDRASITGRFEDAFEAANESRMSVRNSIRNSNQTESVEHLSVEHPGGVINLDFLVFINYLRGVPPEITLQVLRDLMQPKGLSDEAILKIEKKKAKYSEGEVKSNCNTCVICYEDFLMDEEVISLPCEHPFHSGCILTWLKGSKLCPLCKIDLDEVPEQE